ncbi:hypothetical protein O181_104036 [Austropuccinia psidii MF-1]|uniref:Uncharacterized protein n=1 Tax=Austropuccinia psidii MF-1 TaxID=1389203 RepID=A0A9Q3PL15_9BASI|nr:hypothetical protein [Austropuccinia psidii MF-1]
MSLYGIENAINGLKNVIYSIENSINGINNANVKATYGIKNSIYGLINVIYCLNIAIYGILDSINGIRKGIDDLENSINGLKNAINSYISFKKHPLRVFTNFWQKHVRAYMLLPTPFYYNTKVDLNISEKVGNTKMPFSKVRN